jgi:hypothetical protein
MFDQLLFRILKWWTLNEDIYINNQITCIRNMTCTKGFMEQTTRRNDI